VARYTKQNLNEVEDQAPKFGMPEELDARFARTALGGETLGLSLMRSHPGSGSRSGASTSTRRRST
jgi:hypothetical protein